MDYYFGLFCFVCTLTGEDRYRASDAEERGGVKNVAVSD